jgi:hypothetical protein
LFAALQVLPDSSRLPAYLPPVVLTSADAIKGLIGRFWDQFADEVTASVLKIFAIENLLWISLLLTVVCFSIELLVRDHVQFTSSFDQLVESPERARRFIWLVTGFVVTCLTALPILVVAGQVLVLVELVGPDMVNSGWAN